MIPKKIYINDKAWSEAAVSVSNCDMQNREYIDLSQVWHEASEMPERFLCEILYEIRSENGFEVTYMPEELYADDWWNVLKVCGIVRWAYISDLLPKQFGNSKQVKGGEQ